MISQDQGRGREVLRRVHGRSRQDWQSCRSWPAPARIAGRQAGTMQDATRARREAVMLPVADHLSSDLEGCRDREIQLRCNTASVTLDCAKEQVAGYSLCCCFLYSHKHLSQRDRARAVFCADRLGTFQQDIPHLVTITQVLATSRGRTSPPWRKLRMLQRSSH